VIAGTMSLLVAVAPACGGGDDRDGDGEQGSAPCGTDEQERVDPSSFNHVLAGGDEPDYATDPPTSGPHEPGVARSGVLDVPLSRPQQVGQLEAGAVLLQHRDLPADQRAALEGLAADRVVVLPNADLPAPVVATAWTRKLTCETVDADALEALAAFAEAHVGDGPGTDG
jgi:hypothetical protein